MSAPYLGDYAANGTVHFIWSTNDVDGTSITRGTDGTVQVYKNNDNTGEVTTGVTDTEDFDSLTGLHACTIVLTDAYYATGKNYTVVVKGAVIGGKTVNAVLAHFSIQNRYGAAPTAAVVAAAVWDEALSSHTSAGTAGKKLGDQVNPDNAAIAGAVWDEAASGHTTAATFGKILQDLTTTTIATAVWASGTRSLTTFGTLAADTATAVWAAGTRSLTTFGTLVADVATAVWGAGTRTLTALGNTLVDEIFKRDMSAITGEASRSMLNAMRFIRNKWAIVTGTLTVYKEDDSTSAYTATVTTSTTVAPVTSVDPS